MGSLLPQWLEGAFTAAYVVVAASHLRHMAQTGGQRRAWHACHVLMAVGMAFMYLPAAVTIGRVPASLWQVAFASAGVLAAGWALAGVGRVATIIWLLTSLDLAVMLLMWSPALSTLAPALILVVVAYLLAEAVLWLLDSQRRLDGSIPILRLQLLGSSGTAKLTATTDASAGLLGDLDISVSMAFMTLGMAYMLAAMVFGGA